MAPLLWQGPKQQGDAVEFQLIAKGYRLVQKRDENTLLPGEYTKTHYTGSETSFDGPENCTLRWVPMPGDQ